MINIDSNLRVNLGDDISKINLGDDIEIIPDIDLRNATLVNLE